MIRYLLLGVWAILVAVGSVYAGVQWSHDGDKASHEDQAMPGLDYIKTQPISVPVVRDAQVQGYVLAQFVYTMDSQLKGELPVPLDVFLLDEAFRSIYANEDIDFEDLKRYDLNAFTMDIRTRINARFKTTLVHEVLIAELNFISLDMVREKLARKH